MTCFLFWNINRKPLAPLIAHLAVDYKADFVMLAESGLSDSDVLRALNAGSEYCFYPDRGLNKRIKIYSRRLKRFIEPLYDGGGIAIRHVRDPIGDSILLAVVHMPSKLHLESEDQTFYAHQLSSDILKWEEKVGHSRTVVTGDFNMNPFETGIAAANGFHAVMDRRIARRESRIVREESRKFFYNPMWGCFGDTTEGPPGTYYYDTGNPVNLYWNVFDQVLIRPSLLDSFNPMDMAVVTRVGDVDLLDGRGQPNRDVASDHLPIVFRIDI